MARASLRYLSHRDRQEDLWTRLHELAASGIADSRSYCDGTGGGVNAKRIYRLYAEEGLMVRTKVRVRAARRHRVPQAVATAPNQPWSTDFMSARVVDGRWFRILTVVDQFTRECLCLVAD